jgi:hypothetical protein
MKNRDDSKLDNVNSSHNIATFLFKFLKKSRERLFLQVDGFFLQVDGFFLQVDGFFFLLTAFFSIDGFFFLSTAIFLVCLLGWV